MIRAATGSHPTIGAIEAYASAISSERTLADTLARDTSPEGTNLEPSLALRLLNRAVAQIRVRDTARAVAQALKALPPALANWGKALDASHATQGESPRPPRIPELAAFGQSLAQCERLRSELAKSPNPEGVALDFNQASALLKHAIAALNAAEASKVADYAILQLPEAQQTWAKQRRSNATTESAQILIERNTTAIAVRLHNLKLSSLEAIRDKTKGDGAPSADVRALLRNWLDRRTQLHENLKSLKLARAFPLTDVDAALKAFPVSRLSVSIPAAPTAEGQQLGNAPWTEHADLSLRNLWQEMDQQRAQGRMSEYCPLTGDRIDPDRLAEARKAADERRLAAMASGRWKNFIAIAEKASPDLAKAAREGEYARIHTAIEAASAKVSAFVVDHDTDRTAEFWNHPADTIAACRLADELGSFERGHASAIKWLMTASQSAGYSTPVEFLDAIAGIEDDIRKHGAAQPVLHTPFATDLAPRLHDVEKAFATEAKARADLESTPNPAKPDGWKAPATLEEAETRLSLVHAAFARHAAISLEIDRANAKIAGQETVFAQHVALAREVAPSVAVANVPELTQLANTLDTALRAASDTGSALAALPQTAHPTGGPCPARPKRHTSASPP